MSLVTNTGQSSASVAIRLAKLQNLYQVLTQGKADKHISKAFSSLKKIDQEGICKKIHGKEVGSSTLKQKKTLISVVTGRIETLSQSKTICTFQTSVGKNEISANPFTRVPDSVQTTVTGSFSAPKDLANFRASFKEASKFESASHIIKTYHLDDLIETYLHRSCTDLNESGKINALHELMSVAYSLSEIEQLPNPSYSSLPTFFQEIEARNLIRAIEELYEDWSLPDLPENAKDFSVPKDSAETIQKAERLRDWIHQHQALLADAKGVLDLSDCRLSLIPKEICLLQAIEELSLNNNRLVSVPKEIGQLKALQQLSLENNRLVRVAKEIGQLKALQELYLNNNRLVRVPKEIGQLEALEQLDLQRNCLISAPKKIGRLKALKWLYLNNNRLVRVHKEIGQLEALEELDLHNNRLVSVPKEIGQLNALQKFRLDNNRLAKVPKKIGQLQALKKLRLDNNGLINLPAELDRFKGDLEKQNKQLQLKTILRQLSLCVTGQHNTIKIADLFNTMEKLFGNETRSQIHRCLYEVAQKAAKTDKALRKKLKDKHFARKAFLGENINPKVKAAAIAKFRKSLEK